MKYFKNFFKNEGGVETIEWLAALVITAILIGIAAACGSAVQDRMENISDYL